MASASTLVRANQKTSQVITCSTTDCLVNRFSISAIFFYREKLPSKLLIAALEKVLASFPLFSGRLKIVEGNLLIDCNNKGAQFSLHSKGYSLAWALDNLSQVRLYQLVNTIDARKALASQRPILSIRLTHFACGGTALGVCCHHSIGDMRTFMNFMKAWSAAVNGTPYSPPLVIENRNAYLQEKLASNENVLSNVRHITIGELLKLTAYVLTTARKQTSVKLYFSDSEIANMRQVFSEKAGQRLSRNDVLCAHIFSLITRLDNYDKDRYLGIPVDYRSKTGLSENLLGNLMDTINISVPKNACPFEVAKSIRKGINSFETDHLSVMPTHRYVEDNGGVKKSQRFVSKSVDPIRRAISITNWSKFGVYDIDFLDAKPLYFTSVDYSPVPWIFIIVNGFSNQGLICSANLPTKLAQRLKQPDSLKRLHQYRDRNEVRPSQIKHLAWLH